MHACMLLQTAMRSEYFDPLFQRGVLDIHMMACLDGRERTVQQWCAPPAVHLCLACLPQCQMEWGAGMLMGSASPTLRPIIPLHAGRRCSQARASSTHASSAPAASSPSWRQCRRRNEVTSPSLTQGWIRAQ